MAKNVITARILADESNESNLFDALGIEESESKHKEKMLSMHGLPEFGQKEKNAYCTVIVHFRNQEDLEHFAELIEQPHLTQVEKRKKSLKTTWHPKLELGERGQNSLLVWMDENDPRIQHLYTKEQESSQ